jgi:RND family efflux transporter MFP subunit
MKSKLYIHILSTVVVAGFLAGCSSASKDKATQLNELKTKQAEISKQIATLEAEIAKENPEAVAVKAKEVAVTEVTPRSFEHFIQTQGTIESEENVMVSAKTMGIITNVLVKEGDMVSKGQTLAQIDNTLILKGIEELKSGMELANTVYERQKNLWDKKIGTEVQFLQAKSNKESLEKRLASLQEQNEMTRIKSPISGLVDAVDIKVGQNIAPGMPAVRVVNTSDLKISANMSESYARLLAKGNKVIVSFPDIDKTIETKLSFVGKNINQLSRTFSVEAPLPSASELRPNMTAIIKVVYETSANALVVPINVVQELNGEKIVYVAEASGNNMIARKRVVTVEGVFNGFAEVKGLNAGDKLITFGFQSVSEGGFVKI